MISSKSQRIIAILVDCNSDFYTNKSKCMNGSSSTKILKNYHSSFSANKKQNLKYESQTCKNNNNQINTLFKAKKQEEKLKSRKNSSTLITQSQSNIGASQQLRKRQLDQLCLQRMLNLLKKYLVSQKQKWDIHKLNYHQLIKILWIFRYVNYPTEEHFFQKNHNDELKQIYSLWLSISTKLHFKLHNLLIIISTFQNINTDLDMIISIVQQFQNGLDCDVEDFNNYNHKPEPQYTFFLKKQIIQKDKDGLILVQNDQKQKIVSAYKNLKLNRLNNCSIIQCVPEQKEHTLVSKKSTELAQSKRKKIQNKIRQCKPEITTISLHDILSFKQSSSRPQPRKVFIKPKFKKVKKMQVQHLYRPKPQTIDRSSDEIQFCKDRDQYTFHPKISNSVQKHKNIIKKLPVKNVDKVVLRMKEARMIKNQKQLSLEKGWTNRGSSYQSQNKQKQKFIKKKIQFHEISQKQQNDKSLTQLEKQTNKDYQQYLCQQMQIANKKQQNYDPQNNNSPQKQQKVSKYQVSKDYLKIPLLYIDVNIDQGRKERIIIYDNDTAQNLASQFSKKHNLSEETMQKLKILLQQQMDTVLSRIDEETEDQCSYIL